MILRALSLGALFGVWPILVAAQGLAPFGVPPGADILILGEVHDNPAHHRTQAEIVAAAQPAALVFEMLSPEAAAAANGVDRRDAAALDRAVDWSASGWPPFEHYFPIFAAAPEAAIYGAAVPREAVRAAMQTGADAQFDAAVLAPLPPTEQSEREAMQAEAHCNALPQELLPGMVEAQRYRDARFAETALLALAETGGPVVVVTGNGHARRDWGMPVYIAILAPDASVWSLGQFEAAPDEPVPFDAWHVTAPAERPDPCAAFR